MKRAYWLLGAGLALTSAWALAQGTTAPGTAAGTGGGAPRIEAEPVFEQGGSAAKAEGGPAKKAASPVLAGRKIPSLAEIEALTPEALGELLGLKPKFDIPPAARRAMKQVGVLDVSEGGLPHGSLARQNASLVAAAIKGNRGPMVSRWGHILLRRALVSRFDAPQGMNPADFAAMRAALLVRMGEGDAARALVQDVDAGNYTADLTQAAFDAYVATADFTGICPAVVLQGKARKDPQWQVASAMCNAFRGEGAQAMRELDKALNAKTMPRVDVLLAQKYAGAAGKARRAVKIEWDDVDDMTPFRYALTMAVGLEPPAKLLTKAPVRLEYMAATAPMIGLSRRAQAADSAAGAGILSGAAMVDLYGQIYAEEDVSGEWAKRAGVLREAYVADSPSDRLDAIRTIWGDDPGARQYYSRQVLTAYAAARMPVDKDFADDAAPLIASMLSAGLDHNAMAWAPQVEMGSEAWALLALAAPSRSTPVQADAIASFNDDDESEDGRKTAFLLAGLAGLGRVTPEVTQEISEKLDINLKAKSRWSVLIDQAAEVNNTALVVLLAGAGMQGASWDKMTPRHLYHIISALNRVGLSAEARMIAAEAVARG